MMPPRRSPVIAVTAVLWVCSGCNLFSVGTPSPNDRDSGTTLDSGVDPGDAGTDLDSTDQGRPLDHGEPRDANRDMRFADGDAVTGDAAPDTSRLDLGDMPTAEMGADASDVSIGTDAGADTSAPPVVIPFENEPAGHVVVAEHDFSFVPSEPGAGQPIAGFWNLYPSYPQADLASDASVTAPASPDSVVAITMPSGMTPGSRTWWLEAWDAQFPTFVEAYLSIIVQFEGADFENDEGGILLGFLAAGLQGPGEDRRIELWVPPTTSSRDSAFSTRLRIYEFETKTLERTLDQNVDLRALLTTGAWHQIELRVRMNTLGLADGELALWIDGILTLEYTDVEIQTPAYDGDVGYFLLLPDWRGLNPRDDTDRILVDHVRITGG